MKCNNKKKKNGIQIISKIMMNSNVSKGTVSPPLSSSVESLLSANRSVAIAGNYYGQAGGGVYALTGEVVILGCYLFDSLRYFFNIAGWPPEYNSMYCCSNWN